MLALFLFLAPTAILLSALFHAQYSIIFELCRITAGAALFLVSFAGWGSLFLRCEMQNKWHLSIVLGTAAFYVICILLAVAGFFRQLPVLCFAALGAIIGIYRLYSTTPRFSISE